MHDNRKIGVFDSGIGGLGILNMLMNKHENEEYLYIADEKNYPYGVRMAEEIENIVLNVGKKLIQENVKMIIIACNTATANKSKLEKYCLDNGIKTPIVGVIEPTARYAAKATKNKKILVMATNATINSGLYNKALLEIDNELSITAVPASPLALLVEEGLMGTKIAKAGVKSLLLPYKNIGFDTIILGCTHFDYLSKEIQSLFPKARLISSVDAILPVFEEALIPSSEKKGRVTLCTTSSKDEFLTKVRDIDKYSSIIEINVD